MKLVIQDEIEDTPFNDSRPIRDIMGSKVFANTQRLFLIYQGTIDRGCITSFILDKVSVYTDKLDLFRVGYMTCTYILLEFDMIYPLKDKYMFDIATFKADIRIPVSCENWERCVRYMSVIDIHSRDLSNYTLIQNWHSEILKLLSQYQQPPTGYWDRGLWIKGNSSFNVNIILDDKSSDKTQFIKSLVIDYSGSIISICGSLPEDILYLVSDKQLDGKIIIVQLNDVSKGNNDIYEAIELIKDGILGKISGLCIFTTWVPCELNPMYHIWKILNGNLIRQS